MKVINLILGLATAIIIAALAHLGIKAFHPEPIQPQPDILSAKPFREFNCEKGDKECLAEQNAFYAEQDKQNQVEQLRYRAYEAELKVYNRDFFILANIIGILVFVGGFLLIFQAGIATHSVGLGVMIAGLYNIISGYVRGWDSTNDQLKFFVGLIVAGLIIGGSIWLMQRYAARKKN